MMLFNFVGPMQILLLQHVAAFARAGKLVQG
jgi:hypothetical protein